MVPKNPIIGNTNTRFKTFEPIIFPTTIWCLPFLKAATVAANSGKLVPRAIIVKPIINSEIPKRIAVLSAKIIETFAPAINPTRP